MNPQENNVGASAPQPAPQPEPTTPPVPEPAPVPQPEPTTPPVPEPAPAPHPEQPVPEPNLAGSIVEGSPKQPFFKNKKAMIIIGAVLGVFAIGGIVAAVVVNSINNAPEKVVFTAIEKFTKAKNHNIVGHIEFTNNSIDEDDSETEPEDCVSTKPVLSIDVDGDDAKDEDTVSLPADCIAAEPTVSTLSKMKIDLTLNSNGEANASFGAKVTSTMSNGDEQKFDAESIYINDGTIYLKISGLEDSIVEDTVDNFDGLGSIISDIDGTWIAIDIPEIIDTLEKFGGDIDTDTMKKAFECSVDAIKNSRANQEKIYKIFTETKPIKTVEEKKGAYSITVDADGITKFINQSTQNSFIKDIEKCADKIDDFTVKVEEVKSSDVSKFVNSLKELSIKVNKNRELTDLHLNISDNDATLVADFSFTYPESNAISAPNKSKTVVDLFEKIVSAIMFQQLQSQYSTVDYNHNDINSAYELDASAEDSI